MAMYGGQAQQMMGNYGVGAYPNGGQEQYGSAMGGQSGAMGYNPYGGQMGSGWNQQSQGGYGYGPVRKSHYRGATTPYCRPASQLNSKGFPVRNGEKTCSFYEKTGRCNYGGDCRWNHPEEIARKFESETNDMKLNSKGFPFRPGSQPCKYYEQYGTCSFGVTCRWHHPEGIEAKQGEAKLNSRGLPIRADQKVCDFYMKAGNCKFGITCKFNHPEPSGGGGGVSIGYAYGGTDAKLNQNGYPSRPGEQLCSFYMKTGQCRFGAICRFDHPDGITPDASALGMDAGQQPSGYNSKGYPMREGAPDCSFFLKSGECKFGSTCRFNHPEDSTPRAELNSDGLPIRRGVAACKHYSKTGNCNFGSTCKWDHSTKGGAASGMGGGHMSGDTPRGFHDGPGNRRRGFHDGPETGTGIGKMMAKQEILEQKIMELRWESEKLAKQSMK